MHNPLYKVVSFDKDAPFDEAACADLRPKPQFARVMESQY